MVVLLIGLGLRFAMMGMLPREGFISDEAEYLASATWLAQGRGFAWHQGWFWTRAPLYPLFLAAHIRLFGITLAPIYLSQILLSLLNIVLVYVLALGIGSTTSSHRNERRAWIAAFFAAIFFPFVTYPHMLLSETLYLTLLLTAFIGLTRWAMVVERGTAHCTIRSIPGLAKMTLPPALPLWLAGGVFGLATLTRGLTLGFLPIVAGWVWWVSRRSQAHHESSGQRRPLQSLLSLRPIRTAGGFLLAVGIIIAPWSLYASMTYGGPVIVDTTGGFNLLVGARTAYDGKRNDATPRNFVLALLDEGLDEQARHTLISDSCLYQRGDARLLNALSRPVDELSQAARQQLMIAEGVCLIQAAPVGFLAKSGGELVDLFQINYAGDERMTDGFAMGRISRWYSVALFLLEDTLYVVLVLLAVGGWATLRHAPMSRLIGLWWLYHLLTAPLLFAINRFRLPMLIFVTIYAAAAIVAWRVRTSPPTASPSSPSSSPTPRLGKGTAFVLLLIGTIVLAPHAYLQSPPSSWASYLGPYPSSVEATVLAWKNRPMGVRDQRMIAALHSTVWGGAEHARELLAKGGLSKRVETLAPALIAGLEGDPAAGLALLPDEETITATGDWRASVVRGALLRRMGREEEAKAAFTPVFVDDHNPVVWAWEWLSPPPVSHIDLAGNLDLGYIQGFYLGEGDPSAGGTFRWSGPQGYLRFPQQGTGQPQQLCFRADGRGYPTDHPLPTLTIVHRGKDVALVNMRRAVETYCRPLPPTPIGEDVLIIIRSPIFIPDAADLRAQQGPQVGQLRLLGVRLDWAEVRSRAE